MSAETSVASSSGSPTTSASTFGHDALDELVAHRVVDVDALHRDAGLAGVAVAAGDDLRGRELEVGVGLDDHRRVVAELEADLLARRPALMPQPTSGEPVNVIIATSGWSTSALPTRAAAAGDDVEPTRREAALVEQDLGEQQRGERRLRRGLEHDRAPGRDRRRDLVRTRG